MEKEGDIKTPIESIEKHGYSFVKHLGKGGFGSVLLAKHNIDKNLYAIKSLLINNPERQDNLLREIKFLSRLNYPNVVNYRTSFSEDNILFLVMEYCSKGTLNEKKTQA